MFSLARRRLRRAADNSVRGRCEEDRIAALRDPGAGGPTFRGRENVQKHCSVRPRDITACFVSHRRAEDTATRENRGSPHPSIPPGQC